MSGSQPPTGTPARAGLILSALIMSALVCNINLAVANVALPDIGKSFGASQIQLNLIAVGCTLGLAMSVLYFGALGDRYGRKMMLTIGLIATLVTSVMSAFSPDVTFLAASRLLTGLAAGMAYPTTLALITALWAPGIARTKAIALWSGISASSAALGPAIAGQLLEHFSWGSVFLIAFPLAAIALVLVLIGVPSGVNESTEKVDHFGGVLSVFMVASLVLAVTFIGSPQTRTIAYVCGAVTIVAGIAFFIRQKRAENPLYDLVVASRKLFWVPAVAGMIVFGSMMGAAFVGQQFLQNVLGLSTALSGLSALPSAIALIIAAPISAQLILKRGSRFTMLAGYFFVLLAFITMAFWSEIMGVTPVVLTYLFIGFGAGLALTPASRSLTSSTPVKRVGMASGTSDLQRDLGGSVMQSLLGSILAAGFATSIGKIITSSADANQISAQVTSQLQASYGSASDVAGKFPQYAQQILEAAKQSFMEGSHMAVYAGIAAVLVGGLVILFGFPTKQGEIDLTDKYQKVDA